MPAGNSNCPRPVHIRDAYEPDSGQFRKDPGMMLPQRTHPNDTNLDFLHSSRYYRYSLNVIR